MRLADRDQLVPAAQAREGGRHHLRHARLLRVGRVELQQRAPALERDLRLPAQDERLEALDQQPVAVGQLLQQARGGADGGLGVGVAVAPVAAPLLDLRLLHVGLGERGIEGQRLVQLPLGLLPAAAPAERLPGERLDVGPGRLDRLRGEPRGAETRGAGPGRGRQVVQQLQAEVVDGVEQVRRIAPAHGGGAVGASADHVGDLGRQHELVVHPHERPADELLGVQAARDLGRVLGRRPLSPSRAPRPRAPRPGGAAPPRGCPASGRAAR